MSEGKFTYSLARDSVSKDWDATNEKWAAE
jgi:hypothetical protein